VRVDSVTPLALLPLLEGVIEPVAHAHDQNTLTSRYFWLSTDQVRIAGSAKQLLKHMKPYQHSVRKAQVIKHSYIFFNEGSSNFPVVTREVQAHDSNSIRQVLR
jgi:hypothetical protein